MLKFSVAAVVLMFGFAATNAPAIAGTPDEECVDCPVSNKYDSEEVVQKIRNLKQIDNEAPIDVRSKPNDFGSRRVSQTHRGVRSGPSECADCAPRRKYDSQEVIKKVRNVDHSRVINTRIVVPARTRYKESNHLVIHKNETRHTGVVQHNRVIVEKEIRYVRRIPVQTRVEFITHDYRAVERPDSITVPVRRVIGRCSDRGGLLGTYGNCGPTLRVRG